MTRAEFERLVLEAVTLIPKRFRREIKNLALVVESEPSAELLEEMEIEPPDTLYGLYQGTPLPERTWAWGNSEPDRITIFRRPILADCETEDEIIVAIGETVIHEFGHYFGLSEEEIDPLFGFPLPQQEQRAQGSGFVIDESGYWRMKEGVALVVPEVNPQAALEAQGIIASPNCSTTQMVLALKPLHDAARVRRVIVSTYQATSGAGVQGTRDLLEGTRARPAGEEYRYAAFRHPIAFNAIPQIGGEKEAGYTSEEMKMVYETRKIMGAPQMQISATCVRIPVSNCHSETIWVETERPVSPEEARELFASMPGVRVVDDLGLAIDRHQHIRPVQVENIAEESRAIQRAGREP